MALTTAHIVVSVLLIIVILLQAQGSGLSGAFGGGGEFFRSRRSAEKVIVWITVGLIVVFAGLSIVLLIPR